jgi:hypothetical protein
LEEAAWGRFLGEEGSFVVVADDLLGASSGVKSRAQKGKRENIHVRVPVHSLAVNEHGDRDNTPFSVGCKVKEDVPNVLLWSVDGH